jgi:two-component system nitrogen regulation response regulator GlnG
MDARLRGHDAKGGAVSEKFHASQERANGLSATVEQHLRDYFAAHERGLPASGLYGRVLQEIERPLLAIALDECRGNQLRAAALLGLNRNTLRKKIRELGLYTERRRKNGVTANDE